MSPTCLLLSATLILAPKLVAQATPYSLPGHRGAMVLDLDGLKITEVSAKPQDTEVGVRAENAADTMPDPAADPNLLKLKNDPKFWDFVLGLPPKATKP